MGYYVWYREQQTKYSPTITTTAPRYVSNLMDSNNANEETPSNNTQKSTVTKVNYLVIKQWNIRFQTNGEVNFTYSYIPQATNNLSGLAYAQFNTSALSSYCANNANDNAGSLGRSAHDPEWFHTEFGQGGPAYTLIKQIGGYYYYYFGPQDSCPYSSNNDLQVNTMSILKADLETIQTTQ